MSQKIEAIFVDVGNTLRIVVKDDDFQAQARKSIKELVGAPESPDIFMEILEERYKVLRKRAKELYIEATEKEMWTKWMLPDYPAEKIAPLSGKLTRLWRECNGRRVARPDVTSTVIELNKRGYVLGIIANTVTESEIPDWLEEDNLTDYFKTVVLSSKVGVRKPGPEIYLIAAQRAGVDPARSIYVGDNPSRDILGARKAGYGMVIIINEPDTLKKEPHSGDEKPDMTIDALSDLLDIFPGRS
ncbi:MAG: HAD family hydrolase [Anaerolineaceae bacterium]|nr:HAD family hydrolase [Anaerolineaceae bacterium]